MHMNLLFHLLMVFAFVAADYDYTGNAYIKSLNSVDAFDLSQCRSECSKLFRTGWTILIFFKTDFQQLSKCMEQCYDYQREYIDIH